MYELLKGFRIVEGASFVAAPLCGLTFVQLGADVIRFDPIGGGPDFYRWPLAPGGLSFYWEGLNKGKRSIAIDLNNPKGRELAVALATMPGPQAGYFVTNYPANGFLSHEKLSERRADMITVRVTGSSDGRNAVDYTVNCATGYPDLTGPADSDAPVNHVLPAWDVATGLTAAVSLLAAAHNRSASGEGREIQIPLSNVAFSVLSALGNVGEVSTFGRDRPKFGNAIYGTFGRDFVTRDGRRLMIATVTRRQWSGLVEALGLQDEVTALEKKYQVDFAADEGARFERREELFALVEERVARRNAIELIQIFDEKAVGWGEYHTVSSALRYDDRLSVSNPMFEKLRHPSGESYIAAGFPGVLRGADRAPVRPAPRLGMHTDEILAGDLGLSDGEIGKLHDSGIVAGPDKALGR